MKIKINNCSIKHIETMVPKKVINNQELNFDKRLIKKIIKSTGVEQRHVLQDNESLLPLYVKVAQETMTKLNWSKDSIDGVVVVSQTPEYKLPATSAILQGALGLSSEVFSYDISMGCSGYIYGLFNAMSNISCSNGEIKRVLLFVGDAVSTIVNEKNKSNVFLFGDGVSCTAIEYDKNASSVPFILKTDGAQYDNIIIEDGGLKNRISLDSFNDFETEDGTINSKNSLHMDGAKVFNFTVDSVPAIINETLEYSNFSKDDINTYYFHQANKFMLNFLSTKVGIAEKTPINIEKFGNTSCCSIPLLITDFKFNGSLSMLVGFGVGMSMGTAIIDLSKVSFGHCEEQ